MTKLFFVHSQVDYAVKCIQKLIVNKNMSAVEPKLAAQKNYMAKLNSDMKETVWNTSCQSWYKNESGQVTNIYPNTVARFKLTLGKFDEKDYVDHPSRK